MIVTEPESNVADAAIATETVALVRRWLRDSAAVKVDPSAARLATVLAESNGLKFATGFVDGVARPEDTRIAGRSLERIAHLAPGGFPGYLKAAIHVGGAFGPLLPWPVVPVARRVLRQLVGHLVLDVTPQKLGPSLARLTASGNRLNLNVLGEAVLGEDKARQRLEGTLTLLSRPDVDYVSIKVTNVASGLSNWAFESAVDRVVEALTPLFEYAAAAPGRKFINLDMETYQDLDLTVAAFTRLLDREDLHGLEAGIAVQAYLPDGFRVLQELSAWARARVASGGAPIKMRLVKGANLAMERVDAELHGWPLASYAHKLDTDVNYKRMLRYALTPENTAAIRIGVASHNLFDVAYAWLLAGERGVRDRVDFEMLLGMAAAQADVIRRDVGPLVLYTPVVDPAEFDSAIAYLMRRLEENASPDNFMSALPHLDGDGDKNEKFFIREQERFLASLAVMDSDPPLPHRGQNRRLEWEDADGVRRSLDEYQPPIPERTENLTAELLGLTRGSEAPTSPVTPIPAVHNEPDTDPSLPANREWARRILARVPDSDIGTATINARQVNGKSHLGRIINQVASHGKQWGELPAAERAVLIRRAGLAISANRDRLIEVMASETGKTIAEADTEVSEAVDFAYYYADRAYELDSIQGALFVPPRLTVVTSPWNFPVSIPAGSVLAALAAGSGVIVKPAPEARRSGAVLAEALWEAGIPPNLLALVDVAEGDLGERLVTHPAVDRVILTGAYQTAAHFKALRPDLPLTAETSGKNALVVTPSADLDLAVWDVVRSAFGHAGQKCSAASLLILVGSVGKSERFRRQLVDAAESLKVGYPADPATQVGPLIAPAEGKLLRALTELESGESWLLKPRQRDEDGRLFSPGIKDGVAPGSFFHLTECFGPVLGIMHAADLDEAIRLQNSVEYGLTAGLHSLDPDEIATWVQAVEAGNLYVNRTITGAVVGRQPFGGWKRSSIGAGAKAGGPNYVMSLGDWMPEPGRASSTLHLRGIDRRVAELIEFSQSELDYRSFDLLRRSALSDALAWRDEFGHSRDLAGLKAEQNVFRYLPMPATIRIAENGVLADGLRVIAAALRSRSPFRVSSAVPLPEGVKTVLGAGEHPWEVCSDADWLHGILTAGSRTQRIRLVGGDAVALAEALRETPDVAVFSSPVTWAGRVELLPFLREQVISITAHRFGTPVDPVAL